MVRLVSVSDSSTLEKSWVSAWCVSCSFQKMLHWHIASLKNTCIATSTFLHFLTFTLDEMGTRIEGLEKDVGELMTQAGMEETPTSKWRRADGPSFWWAPSLWLQIASRDLTSVVTMNIHTISPVLKREYLVDASEADHFKAKPGVCVFPGATMLLCLVFKVYPTRTRLSCGDWSETNMVICTFHIFGPKSLVFTLKVQQIPFNSYLMIYPPWH